MYRGEVVEHGPTADIFRSPADAYTRRLLSAVPRLGSMNGIVGPRRFDIGEVAPVAQPIAPASVEAMQKARPILEVTGLTKRFPVRSGLFGSLVGRVHAVEDVSFAVEPGETLSLVGESGCGKSTTGRAVMRLIDADTGSVLFDDQDVLKLSGAMLRRMRRGIQMVFQDPFASLNPRMTVGRAITEPLRAHGLSSRRAARDRAAALLEQVGLQADMVTRYPHEFSGGQRQRICIARAISLEPKLVVADESVSALDVSVKAQVVNLLMDLQARLGISYLFISHDMAVVERISHKVAVMYLGEIVEFGRREDIFGNPQHPYTKRLLAAVPVPDPARRSMYRPISNDELRNPLRPVDYTPPDRRYRSAGAGHRVLEWGAEWGG
jgi:peptide/nickel transport system ATP-binding protein